MASSDIIGVSIVIPCYNTAEYIIETLDSISKQTYKNIEIIAVDDGSNDDTYSIIENYKNRMTGYKPIVFLMVAHLRQEWLGLKQQRGNICCF